MSNYISPPIGSAPYGSSPYGAVGGNSMLANSASNVSSYPGMMGSAGAAGIGAGGGYGTQQQQQQQSSYPGMVSQLGPAQSQQQMQAQMQMQAGGLGYGGAGMSPALTGTTAVSSVAPHGVTLLKDQTQQHPFSPPPGGSIAPDSVTYTTTRDATGRTTYHHFRAEPASYRSPQGITYTGIQWVGCGSYNYPPPNAAPAGADFPLMNRGGPQAGALGGYGDEYAEDNRAYRDWGKEEQKRRKKEEKEANKRAAHWEQQQRMRERAEEKELRRAHQNQQMQSRVQEDAEILAARERDAMREREFKQRSRRLSTASRPGSEGLGTVAGAGVYGDAPRQGGGIYDTGRDRERGVYGALGPDVERDLEQRMGDMRVGGGGPGSRLTADYGAPPPLGGPPVGVRSRRSSMSMMPVPTVGGSPLPGAAVPPGGVMMPGPGARVGKMGYDDGEYVDRDYDRDDYPLGPATTNSRRASMHMGGGGGGLGGRGGPSPYRSTSPLPPVMGPGGVPVYPPGHIYEGEPVQGGASGIISRSHSPVPGTAPYPSSMSNPGAVAFAGGGGASGGYGVVPRTPRTPRHDFDAGDQELLATPEAFSRPINRAQTFTPFEMMKIQDLDDFLRNIPRLPVVLTTHDVYAEEWGRLMGDLSLAWQNHLPLPSNLRSGKMPKRTTVVSDLLDSWNAAFFLPRGIEVVLYKGRERLSGRGAGRPETRLPRMDSEDSYSSDDSSDDDLYSDMEPAAGQGGRYGSGHYGLYGRRDERYEQEMRESRLYRRQKKEEKRRRAKERKMHRKEQNKTYSLYMCYVDPSARDPYGRVGGGGSNFGGSQVGGYAGSGYASSGHGL